MRLRDRVALVTGAGQGIGRETALLFAREGAILVVSDINGETGRQTAQEIESSGGRAHFILADVASQEDAQRLIEESKSRFDRIDVLLNNAGIMKDATLLKMTEEVFDQVVAVNLKGTYNCTQAVAPIMIEQGGGKIINVGSYVALYGNFGQSSYVAAKAGVIGMTKVWARELGRKNICVNVVCPGIVATDLLGSVPEDVLKSLAAKVPLGRLAQPIDVAKVYLFLASDDSNYVNGAVISVDGGAVT